MQTIADRLAERSAYVTESGCLIWLGCTDNDGYGFIRVGGKSKRPHRLSFELNKGPIPAGQCVCHKCDTPACINQDHLFLASNAGNTADRHTKGRDAKHERHGCAKLTREQVNEIRSLSARGVSYSRLVSMFGVSKSNISFIVTRGTWR